MKEAVAATLGMVLQAGQRSSTINWSNDPKDNPVLRLIFDLLLDPSKGAQSAACMALSQASTQQKPIFKLAYFCCDSNLRGMYSGPLFLETTSKLLDPHLAALDMFDKAAYSVASNQASLAFLLGSAGESIQNTLRLALSSDSGKLPYSICRKCIICLKC